MHTSLDTTCLWSSATICHSVPNNASPRGTANGQPSAIQHDQSIDRVTSHHRAAAPTAGARGVTAAPRWRRRVRRRHQRPDAALLPASATQAAVLASCYSRCCQCCGGHCSRGTSSVAAAASAWRALPAPNPTRPDVACCCGSGSSWRQWACRRQCVRLLLHLLLVPLPLLLPELRQLLQGQAASGQAGVQTHLQHLVQWGR